ncbi:baseplate J/gp47 family protein [Actinoplanes sp. NPDC026619]|uniref:baseplate J/gp47 family protein n=1 Tax=Actinoplanes sp. NPDC026619 TaxID=3155798 RepID=UPI0033E7B78C
MTTTLDCGCHLPCADDPDQWPIGNPAGLDRIAYRPGDFATFRRGLLRHRPGEVHLAGWRPSAGADLGLAVVDWWAYLADVLAFYTELIANEAYLGTARHDATVRHLVGLLGYRPRPGIGATGRLAVLASAPAPLVVPAGLTVTSKATPAVDSQTFETDAVTTFPQPASAPPPRAPDPDAPPSDSAPPPNSPPGTAEVPRTPRLLARGGVLMRGTPTSIRAGDRLLLLADPWADVNGAAHLVTVTALVLEPDSHGRRNTRVRLSGTTGVDPRSAASGWRLLRPARTAHLASLPQGATVVTATKLVLDAPARQLAPGDPLVVDGPKGTDVVRLGKYQEEFRYAKALPISPTAPDIPVLVAALEISARSGAVVGTYTAADAPGISVALGWTPAGTLLDTPVAVISTLPGRLTLAAAPAAPAGVPAAALLETADGTGTAVTVTPIGGTADVAVAPGPDTGVLRPPLRLLWDLVAVSRGATVRDEVLGVGDATAPGQDFALSRTPVTYLSDLPGRSGDRYSSTIVLTVGDRFWTEVPSLFGHGPAEPIFETWEDDEGRTHIRTGAGETGRRLPTGAAVVATYRVGSGAAVPPPGTLTQLLDAVPNLRGVRNPVPPGGGADPEPAAEIRRLAPRSVLTFGRAISGDDYAVVARAAPGVSRAGAVWEWDADEQRPAVRVYVGDGPAALAAARTALSEQGDPNRPPIVLAATGRQVSLTVSLQIDPSRVVATVRRRVAAALTGLFGAGVLGLGDRLYRSRIEQVVCGVPGVLAARDLRLRWPGSGAQPPDGPFFDPGPGGFFAFDPADLRFAEATR